MQSAVTQKWTLPMEVLKNQESIQNITSNTVSPNCDDHVIDIQAILMPEHMGNGHLRRLAFGYILRTTRSHSLMERSCVRYESATETRRSRASNHEGVKTFNG